MGMCALFREMGRSPRRRVRVFNCDAPDKGNMDLLLMAARRSIQERLTSRPLVRGEITSAFCMTEPAPGAGADPSNLRTAAKEVGDGWVITAASGTRPAAATRRSSS
jgi:acyl-CoA dehydrogenase